MALSDHHHVEYLIGRYLDQCASDSDMLNLSALLTADPQVADELARASWLDLLLEQHFTQQRAELQLLLSERKSPQGISLGRRFTLAASTLAALLVLAVFLWRGQVQREPPAVNQVVSGQVVVDGVVTPTVPFDAQFEVLGPAAASIHLPNGADALLEPATTAVFQYSSETPTVHLTSGGGRIRVQKEESLHVHTPAGTILARDSQFDVNLQETMVPGEHSLRSQSLVLLTVAVLAGQVDVQDDALKATVPVAAGERRVFSKQKVPRFAGRVTDVSSDATLLTLEGEPPKPNAPVPRRTLEINATTKLIYYGVNRSGDRPTVGYRAVATLSENEPDKAVRIEFGDPRPSVSGTVVAVAQDARSITVEIYRKGDVPLLREILLTDQTRLSYRDVESDGERPKVGYRAEIWTEEETDRAIDARFQFVRKGPDGTPTPSRKSSGTPAKDKPEDRTKMLDSNRKETLKPQSAKSKSSAAEKTSKPVKSSSEKRNVKPSTTKSQPAEAGNKPTPKGSSGLVSNRDPMPTAEAIDRIIEQQLADAGIPASPLADDGEFLRRVTLDIAGRVPTYDETLAFLASTDPRKRQMWIDTLLSESSYGAHFATIWRELIGPRETGKSKAGRDPFAEWLAEQFNRNRGWNDMVDEMLTAEGKLREHPQSGFIMANSENQEPRASLVADATSRLFWGVQLRCAECHDHPFAPWKQTDFWGTAAFFSRLRKGYTDGKNPVGWTLTEMPPSEMEERYLAKSFLVRSVPGPAITLPTSAGEHSGTIVKARFLNGDEVDWDDNGPYRPRFSQWATGRDNPYFTANAVNRLWAHFFGRGLVNPLDGFQEGNPPSHPELLEQLSAEFMNSDYDLKHLIRCVCNSRAYQRTSRPASGNEMDTELFSHMAVRVIRPEVLYDSLSVVLYPPVAKAAQRSPVTVSRVIPIPNVPRSEFVHFFASIADENVGSVVNQGIPQFLRLMNSSLFEDDVPGVERFLGSPATREEAIESIYLSAYSRRPTSEELQFVNQYFEDSPDPKTSLSGLMWALLNSSEFLLNH